MMKIGDKVRFLNDVGGGKITAIRPGGIVLVEDEDGFDIPVRADEVVVIETNALNIKTKPAPKVTFGAKPAKEEEKEEKEETESTLKGKEYLESKTVQKKDDEDEVDENLEARVARLELTISKLEMRVCYLESALRQKNKKGPKDTKEKDDKKQPLIIL